MTGDRECSTGQPMTQARFTLMLLAFDRALAPERVEQRQERKAENGEIVAVDLVEQLDPDPFELIGPDTAQDLFAGRREIAADEFRRQLAHAQCRRLAV